jgi:murein DD-endopeptidase MepM/ murein hydrolase activator NlpD
MRRREIHLGTDYAARTGTPVLATAPGTVVRSELSSSYGNIIILNHGGTRRHVYTLYAYGSARLVHLGQHVNTGEQIMRSGNTGHSTGPHLHYKVIRTDIPVGGQGFIKILILDLDLRIYEQCYHHVKNITVTI